MTTPAPDHYRQPPHNIDAEQALLGAILVNNEAYFRVSDFLRPEHFFEPIHAHIYELCAALVRASKVATPVTLKTFLSGDIDVSGMSAPQYLARLAAEATTIINAADYGRAIHDLALRRELINIGTEIVNSAFNAAIESSPQAQIEQAERQLFAVTDGEQHGRGFFRFGEALKDAVDMAAAAYQRDGHLSGIATGLNDLDLTMGGLQASDLIIVAGRPGMGKTSLATNIAYHIAAAHRSETRPDGRVETLAGGIVGFFSLEMSAEQLATRILSEQAQIPSSQIRRGAITPAEFSTLADQAQALQNIPLYIDDSGGVSIAQLVARARRLKRQRGLDLLVVDYLQLLAGSGKAAGRVQEITEITTGLKALAKELKVPVLALSQLSRQVESREDKRPLLSDLRESGSIEQDADVVLFVFREEYYLRGREPKPGTDEWFKWEADLRACEGKAEVIIGKQRHGPTGSVTLCFDARYTRFSNLANSMPVTA